jgi:hypothetical protein
MKEAGELDKGGRPSKTTRSPASGYSLEILGLDKDQSSRWQAIARLSPEDQDAAAIRAALIATTLPWPVERHGARS